MLKSGIPDMIPEKNVLLVIDPLMNHWWSLPTYPRMAITDQRAAVSYTNPMLALLTNPPVLIKMIRNRLRRGQRPKFCFALSSRYN